MNEGGKSGVRSKGTYRRYQTNEGETGKTAGSKDTNDKEALLAISSKETQWVSRSSENIKSKNLKGDHIKSKLHVFPDHQGMK